MKRKTKVVRTGRGEETKGGVVHFQNKRTFFTTEYYYYMDKWGGV